MKFYKIRDLFHQSKTERKERPLKLTKILIVFALSFIILGCAAHTNIEPVGKGNVNANLSFGGPIIAAFNTYIPIPYISSGINYGLDNDCDLNGNLHIFSMFFKVAAIDFGGTWYPVLNDGWIPTIGLQARLQVMASLKNGIGDRFRFFPIFSATGAWKISGNMIYTGFDFAVPLNKMDYEPDYQKFILSPLAGYCWKIKNNLSLFTELKWQGVNIQSNQLAVEYIHPGNYGALAILISFERSF
jgi:hypothetical protein